MAAGGLEDHRRHVASGEGRTGGSEIIRWAEGDRLHRFLHLPGLGAGIIWWLYADLQPLVPAVEVARELHHTPFLCIRARQAQRHVCGFRAGSGKAHHFGARHQATDPLAPLYFLSMTGPIVCSALHLVDHRLADLGWTM